MKSHATHANRLRRRAGISQSGLQKIESIVALGECAVRRSFIAAQRPASNPDHHSITISEGRTYAGQ